MSIFYNYKISGSDSGKNDTIATFRGDRTSTILDKANDYEVAVVRFKIPSSTLTKYEYVSNDRSLEIGNYINLPIINANQGGTDYQATIGTRCNLNGYGGNSLEVTTALANNSLTWDNNETIAEQMSASLFKSIASTVAKVQSDTTTVDEIIDNYLDVEGSIASCLDNRTKLSTEYNITLPTAGYTNMINYWLRIYDVNITGGGSLKDCQFFLNFKPNTKEDGLDFKMYLARGIGGDLTDLGNDLSSIILSPMYCEDAQAYAGNKKFTKLGSGSTQQNHYGLRPTIGGKITDTYNRRIGIAREPPAPPAPVDDHDSTVAVGVNNMGKGTVSFSFALRIWWGYTQDGTMSGGIFKNNPYLSSSETIIPPLIQYNTTEELFEYKIQRGWLLPWNTNVGTGVGTQKTFVIDTMRFCMNYNLSNLFGFAYEEITEGMTQETSFPTHNGEWAGNGVIIKKDLSEYDMAKATDVWTEYIYFKEQQNSNYLRRQTNSIIVSTSMGVAGEILQSQGKTHQILTDFNVEVDQPYSYFQYESQGYLRFYPLKSNLALRQQDIQILTEDIYGNVKQLKLANGEVMSMKLEFRPKGTNFDY